MPKRRREIDASLKKRRPIKYVPNFSLADGEHLPPSTHNVVSVIDMGRTFDEHLICNTLPATEYVNLKFAAMIVRTIPCATSRRTPTARVGRAAEHSYLPRETSSESAACSFQMSSPWPLRAQTCHRGRMTW